MRRHDPIWRGLTLGLSVAVAAVLVSTCGDGGTDPEPQPPTPGAVLVNLTVTGTSPDPDGCTVALDGGAANAIAGGTPYTFASVPPGSHTLLLAEIADNCTVTGDNPRTVSVISNQTTSTTFDVSCPGFVSHFVVDAEGWTSVDNGSGLPQWEDQSACGGSSGGCLSLTDAQGGVYMAFRAPDQWHDATDLSEYYGGQLIFTMKYEGTDNWLATKGLYNVAIVSQTHGAIHMRFPDPFEKGYEGTWQAVAVNLSPYVTPFPGGDLRTWLIGGSPYPATDAQISAILSSVDDILIRAEFDDGTDKGYLDEVRLSTTPDPDLLGILPEAEVVRKFAPLLMFDSKQGDPWKCFPGDAQDYYDARAPTFTWDDSERICNHSYASIQNAEIPTYYQYTRCSATTEYIAYWFFYGWQDFCDGVSGAHHADWEHVVVKVVNGTLNRVIYYQHEGWYTRDPGNYGVSPYLPGHPMVFVGKTNHGSYHDDGGTGTCCYWEDFRKPGDPEKYMLTSLNLFRLDASNPNRPTWTQDGFDWSGPSDKNMLGPLLRTFNFCALPGCNGYSISQICGTNGCFKSDVGSGEIP